MIYYSDASYTNGIAGIACVAVDQNGNIKNCIAKQETAPDVVYAELLAIRENVLLADSMEHDDDSTFYSDCAIAVGLLHNTNAKTIPPQYAELVSEIANLKGEKNIIWDKRDNNGQADALAVLAARRHATVENRNSGCFQFHI